MPDEPLKLDSMGFDQYGRKYLGNGMWLHDGVYRPPPPEEDAYLRKLYGLPPAPEPQQADVTLNAEDGDNLMDVPSSACNQSIIYFDGKQDA